MFRNYIIVAWRNLWKEKTFTLLNLLGLSMAFGVAILLGMVTFHELSYDGFHKNGDALFQVYHTDQGAKGSQVSTSQAVPFADALRKEVPGVAAISRFLIEDAVVFYEGKQLSLETVYTDNDFFSMFSFPIEKGESTVPLKERSSLVITETTARAIFGNQPAVGETIYILTGTEKVPFRVSAVAADFPSHSSLRFDIALSFENAPEYSENINEWSNKNHSVYLQLEDGVSVSQFEENSQPFTALYYAEEIKAAQRDGAQADLNGLFKQLRLFPFEDVHFAKTDNGVVMADKTYSYLILGVGLLILFIASVNFINMCIANNAQRIREIGMRKSLGATKAQLFFQFWAESIFVFLCAVGLGILLSNLLLAPFQQLFRTSASLSTVTSPEIFLGFIIGFLIITLVAGGYPALVLSKLGTLQALKGKMQLSGKDRTRNVLMIVQFSIAILLISGSFVLWSQLEYMRTKDLGFEKEQVVSFPLNGERSSGQAIGLLRNKLQNEPGILSVSGADNNLGIGKDGSINTQLLGFDYKGRGVETHILFVAQDYVKTLGLKLVSGRSFDQQFGTDSQAVLINEAMARELQEEDPLHEEVRVSGIDYTIIGVLKDYNFQNLGSHIEPLTIIMNEDFPLDYAFVKVAPNGLPNSFTKIEEAWREIEPNSAFMGSFLDENIDRTFKRERIMTSIITSGALVAIILSCIGLFAVSVMEVTKRTKEIGVRKVLGADVSTISLLLVANFLKLILVAFAIAAPAAWYFSRTWLQTYPYRMDLHIWIFLVAGFTVICIAFITIGYKTLQAALQNPIKSLRSE